MKSASSRVFSTLDADVTLCLPIRVIIVRVIFLCMLLGLAATTSVLADPPHATAGADFAVADDKINNNSSAIDNVVSVIASIQTETPTSLALLDGEILFGLGDFELTAQGRDSLQRLIAKLQRFDRILSIRIIGHTDDVGDPSFNQRLSERRANWIKEHFSQTYPDTHILTVGAGETAPLVSNSTGLGRKRNRRVEVQVIATGKASLLNGE